MLLADRALAHPSLYLGAIQPGLMTKTAMAAKLIMSRTTLWKFMKGETRLDPDLAARLGQISGDGPAFWLEMQLAWDLEQARKSPDMAAPL